jgi:hypothetical protein
MAYVKIKPLKSEKHLQQALDYIQNPKKTEDKIYVSTNLCSAKFAAVQFAEIRKMAMKKGNNIAHHICQSFSPEDKVSAEKAMQIGVELMKTMYPNYQYVIATHIDREHIHNHIIMNSVNYVTYRKLVSNKNTLDELRNISDKLCEKSGLSVIHTEDKSKRQILKECIDSAVENSKDMDEFLACMRRYGYTIKTAKHWAFKRIGDSRYIRSDSIGTAYTDWAIKKRVTEDKNIKNRKRKVYDSYPIPFSQRGRLKADIIGAIKQASDFEDFIKYMTEWGYEVKRGKHLAFKHSIGKRFIRVESLGDEYSEEMLRLRCENYPEYLRRKNQIKAIRIDRVIRLENDINNRYIAAKNVNIGIKTLNYLKENGIENYEQLLQKATELQNIINDDRVWENRKNIARTELKRIDNVVYNVGVLADIEPKKVEPAITKKCEKTAEIKPIQQQRDYYER